MEQQKTTLIPPQTNRFQEYLDRYHLTWLAVARASQVPCATVWLIAHGKPVLPSHAVKVRQTVYRLTGVPYMGPIEVTPYEKIEKRREKRVTF